MTLPNAYVATEIFAAAWVGLFIPIPHSVSSLETKLHSGISIAIPHADCTKYSVIGIIYKDASSTRKNRKETHSFERSFRSRTFKKELQNQIKYFPRFCQSSKNLIFAPEILDGF